MRENSPSGGFAGRALSWLLPFLVISAAYLYTFPQPNIFYAGVVLLHALGGVLTAILLIPALFRLLREGSFVARAGWLLVAAGAVLGIILIKTGTPRTEWKWLYFHILISLIGVGFLIDWDGAGGCLRMRQPLFFVRQSAWSSSPESVTERGMCGKDGRCAAGYRIPRCRPTT
jgi:hypothetical protein